jgi:hypothetical protein
MEATLVQAQAGEVKEAIHGFTVEDMPVAVAWE